MKLALTCPMLLSMLRGVPRLSFPAWCRYLNEMATAKKMEVNQIKTKLINCGPPGVVDGTVLSVFQMRKRNLEFLILFRKLPNLRQLSVSLILQSKFEKHLKVKINKR